MKRTHFLLLAITAILFSACEIKPEPFKPQPTSAYFSFETNNLTVTCTNKSSEELIVLYWKMGDGTTYGAKEIVTHTYEKAGKYEVELTCKNADNTKHYTCTNVVVVTAPGGGESGDKDTIPPTVDNYSEVFLTGFRLYSLNYKLQTNYYVQFELECADLWGNNDPHVLMPTQKVVDYLLPFDYMLQTPVRMGGLPNPYDWYKAMMFTVYAGTSYISQSGDVVLVQYLDDPTVLDGKREYIITQNGSKVGLLFEYK